MTVIAWDGKALAADRQSECGSVKSSVCKIFRVRDGIAGISGNLSVGMEVLSWYEAGAAPERYPDSNRRLDEGATLTVIRAEDGKPAVYFYESSPHPFRSCDPFAARGSGAGEALVAMACGKTASEAVLLAQAFNHTCGLGVDVLEFED
ncbi:hypothetical protein ACSBPU_12785 [Parapusillimonas sp. JC17]|uniref:hypothetical protein n=1 Tax=Parapusillimonas sp. JC17 TaxID=3445768 RepID=UPI003FA00D85